VIREKAVQLVLRVKDNGKQQRQPVGAILCTIQPQQRLPLIITIRAEVIALSEQLTAPNLLAVIIFLVAVSVRLLNNRLPTRQPLLQPKRSTSVIDLIPQGLKPRVIIKQELFIMPRPHFNIKL
jgi:hypothetical protein